MAAAYFGYILATIDRKAVGFLDFVPSKQQLVPTYRGKLESQEQAVHLVEACLRGALEYSRRGPQEEDRFPSDSIFVWESGITAIDRWQDGVEWIDEYREDCVISVAARRPGQMNPSCRRLLHGRRSLESDCHILICSNAAASNLTMRKANILALAGWELESLLVYAKLRECHSVRRC